MFAPLAPDWKKVGGIYAPLFWLILLTLHPCTAAEITVSINLDDHLNFAEYWAV